MGHASSALFVAWVLLVGTWDLRERRIPNWLTVSGAVAGVALCAVGGGRLSQSVSGVPVALVIGLLLYRVNAMGAGDAKFLAAIGAWAGLTRLPEAFLAVAAGGALFAIVWVIRGRVLGLSLISTASMLGDIAGGRSAGAPLVGRSIAGKFPYGVGMGLGAVSWWFWSGAVLP